MAIRIAHFSLYSVLFLAMAAQAQAQAKSARPKSDRPIVIGKMAEEMDKAARSAEAPGYSGVAPQRVPMSLLAETYFRPAEASAGMQSYLVYELHLTNFLPVDMTIEAINVVAAPSGTVLARLESGALQRNGKHIGPAPTETEKLNLSSGRRAAVFLWVLRQPGSPPPPQLYHRVELSVAGRNERYLVQTDPLDILQERPSVISPPLRGGPWVAANAPRPEAVTAHNQLFYPRDGRIVAPQRFATDWVKLNRTGRLFNRAIDRNENWPTFGAEVLAVADGTIMATVSDVPENTPPEVNTPMTRRTVAGNYVVLDIGDGKYAFYGHLRTGSITVRPGEKVKKGQAIARVGNSGNSTGPHLHFHLTDNPLPGQGEGIPFVFDRHDYLGKLRGTIEEMEAGASWKRIGTSESRTRDLPTADTVIAFPSL